MSLLESAIRKYLESQEWKYQFNEERRYFSMSMGLETVDSCRVIIQLKGADGDNGFVVYSVFPINVPEAKRDAIAETLTRINYGMPYGNFEMDYDDGEIRHKIMTRCGDIDLDLDSAEAVVDCGFVMLDRYGNAILSVIYGNNDPAKAVEDAEEAIRNGDS